VLPGVLSTWYLGHWYTWRGTLTLHSVRSVLGTTHISPLLLSEADLCALATIPQPAERATKDLRSLFLSVTCLQQFLVIESGALCFLGENGLSWSKQPGGYSVRCFLGNLRRWCSLLFSDLYQTNLDVHDDD
jgi:hypothetical protein